MDNQGKSDNPSTKDPDHDGPVFMVVSGEVQDAARLEAYTKALWSSGLYEELKGYYLNAARPIRIFEGSVATNFVNLIVRFPSLAAAESFWYSDAYQKEIKPLRLDPSAGDFTVTVYAEKDLPDHMIGYVLGTTGQYIDQ